MKKILLMIIVFFASITSFPWVSLAAEDSNLASPWFMIDVWDISPWIKSPKSSSEDTMNWILWTIIQNMMIALWAISVLIMTIWAWFMILNSWDESLLTKWKTIFMSWVYAVVIALCSYYIVAVVRFLLYNVN